MCKSNNIGAPPNQGQRKRADVDDMTRSSHSTGQKRTPRRIRRIPVPVAGSAVLLIDVINDLEFDGSEALVAQAEPMATRLAVLKRRASAVGVPCIYINDNFGQWRSDFGRQLHTAPPSVSWSTGLATSQTDRRTTTSY